MEWRRAVAILAATVLAGMTGIAVMAGGATGGQATASMAGAEAPVPAQASPLAGHWGDALQVDLSALNPGDGPIGIDALSCASPGNCSAGGHYADSARKRQAFVVTEDGGTWGKPVELTSRGLADFNSGQPLITSLTCPVPDNCAVGGFYHDAAGKERPFINASLNGVWDSVETVGFAGNIIPGGANSKITSMSRCAAFAACAMGLTAPIGTSNEALVTTSINGSAQLVPGIQQLNAGHAAEVDSVSCWSSGNCLAGGFYTDVGHHAHPFIAADINNTWGKGTEVPGLVSADPVATAASVLSVSCPAAGACSGGGFYTDGNQHEQAFVLSQANGAWRAPEPIPGVARLNAGGRARVIAVSCGAPGDCAAVGQYVGGSGTRGFALSEAGFTWRNSPVVRLFPAGYAYTQVSCPAAGSCVAGGSRADGTGHDRPFVEPEIGGVWGSAHELAGKLNMGDGELTALSCTQPGSCAAGGSYTDARGNLQAFVADASPATRTSLSLSAPKVAYGHEQSAKLSVKVTPGTGGRPTGKVAVKAGSARLCSITLGGGTGSCMLAATRLRPGTYHLTASYSGSTVYDGSAAARHSLTVAREPTTTALALSRSKVKVGHEQSERFSVTVKPGFSGTPTGRVTVKASSATLCVITLKNAKGTCTLSASKLRPGTYTINATYPGIRPYAASTSPRKTLTVTK
jgi:hypothetical protein